MARRRHLLVVATAPHAATRLIRGHVRRPAHCIEPELAGFYHLERPRKAVFSIKDFGAVGDGRTSNTEAFQETVRQLEEFRDKGGAQLNAPRGPWLTSNFNLTSNFTLFLEEGDVIGLGRGLEDDSFGMVEMDLTMTMFELGRAMAM
ncbi:putative polygalacturonase [Canna indica]|uniref:Polygalacturonase n=1 Tax=Canna indica TaxID=4628 RepID=A0AAQ3JPS4_9LILI|nr:putative polygalacturonase [Canna indica]